MTASKLLSVAMISRELNIPESTLHYWKNRFAGFLPSVGRGRQKRFRPEALEIFRTVANMLELGHTTRDIQARLPELFPMNVEPSRPAKAESARDIQADGAQLAVPQMGMATHMAAEMATQMASQMAGQMAGQMAEQLAEHMAGDLGERIAARMAEAMGRSLGQSLGQSLGESLGQSLGQSLGESLGASLNQALNRPAGPDPEQLALADARVDAVRGDVDEAVARLNTQSAELRVLVEEHRELKCALDGLCGEMEDARNQPTPGQAPGNLSAENNELRQKLCLLEAELVRLRKDRREMEKYLLEKIQRATSR